MVGENTTKTTSNGPRSKAYRTMVDKCRMVAEMDMRNEEPDTDTDDSAQLAVPMATFCPDWLAMYQSWQQFAASLDAFEQADVGMYTR